MRRWRSRTGESAWYQSVCPRCGRLSGWPSLATITRDEADRSSDVAFEAYDVGADGTCRCPLDDAAAQALESSPPSAP